MKMDKKRKFIHSKGLILIRFAFLLAITGYSYIWQFAGKYK